MCGNWTADFYYYLLLNCQSSGEFESTPSDVNGIKCCRWHSISNKTKERDPIYFVRIGCIITIRLIHLSIHTFIHHHLQTKLYRSFPKILPLSLSLNLFLILSSWKHHIHCTFSFFLPKTSRYLRFNRI